MITETTHNGYTITLDVQAQQRRMACPWYIPALRRHCRNPQHAAEIIDAELAAAEHTGPRLTVLDTRARLGLSAAQCRRRAEKARAQRRQGGRFAKGGAA